MQTVQRLKADIISTLDVLGMWGVIRKNPDHAPRPPNPRAVKF